MTERLARNEVMNLVKKARNPHLLLNKFSKAQHIYDVERRPFSTISVEVKNIIEQEIQSVIEAINEATADPTVEKLNQFLNLKLVKKYSFGNQAMIMRFKRGSAKEEDCVNLSKSLADLRESLEMS